MPESSLLQILHSKISDNTMTLPTMPDVAVKVMSIADRPEINTSDLCAAISRDSGISLRLIRLANSAHFKRKVDVVNLQQATVRLGFRQVRSLVIAMAMEQLFISTDPIIHHKLQDVWLDCVRITTTALAYDSVMNRGRNSDSLMLLGMTSRLGMLSILAEIEKTFSSDILAKLDYTNLNIIERVVLFSIFNAWEFPKEYSLTMKDFFDHKKSSALSQALVFGEVFGGKDFKEFDNSFELNEDQFRLISDTAHELSSILG